MAASASVPDSAADPEALPGSSPAARAPNIPHAPVSADLEAQAVPEALLAVPASASALVSALHAPAASASVPAVLAVLAALRLRPPKRLAHSVPATPEAAAVVSNTRRQKKAR